MTYTLDLLLVLEAKEAYDDFYDLNPVQEEIKTIESKYKRWITHESGLRYLQTTSFEDYDRNDKIRLGQLRTEENNRRENFIINYIYKHGGRDEAYKYCKNSRQLDKLKRIEEWNKDAATLYE